MANSPDVKSYVDLTLFDDDPVIVLNNMLQTGRGLIPEWSPQVGNIEVLLAEVFALRSTELAATANRIPSATVEVLLQLFGLFRSDGVKATAEISVTVTDTATIRTIPAGTQFLYTNAVTGVSYIFVLDETLVFSVGSSRTATASVSAQVVGSSYNFSADGAYLTVLSAVSFVESVTFSVSPSNGSNAESDAEYFSRAVSLLASYTSALTTADQIRYYCATTKTYANRVGVFNRRRYRNRDTTSVGYGYHDGSVLVVVGGLVSNIDSAASELPVSASNLSELYTSLDERTPSGLTIEVMSAELVSVDITATFTVQFGYVASTVKSNIEAALKSYLNPNTWSFDDLTIRRNEIISIIDAVDGVDYVDSLTMGGSPLIGFDNVGYYTLSGGSKTTVNLDISGVDPDGTYDAGQLGFYYVDADQDVPVIYEFTNINSVVISGGGATNVPFEAVSNGLGYNESPGGNVDRSATLLGTGSGFIALGTAEVNSSSAFTGGSDDVSQFTPLDGSVDVSSDIVLRNLGTLVTYGNISVELA